MSSVDAGVGWKYVDADVQLKVGPSSKVLMV